MKKFISVALLLTTLLSVFSSCRSNESTHADSTDNVNESKTETIACEYTSPGTDYNGASFTIAAHDESKTQGWKVLEYNEAYEEELTGDAINDAIYNRNLVVENEFNIKIGFHSLQTLSSASTELEKFIMADEDIAQIALVNGRGVRKMLGSDGYLVDLYELKGVDFSNSWWNQKSIAELDVLGKLYVVVGDVCLYSQFAPMAYFFNKSVAEEYSLENMYDMVRNGTWTIDKLIEMCHIVSNDLNGDGVMDTNDAYGLCHQAEFLGNFLEGFDVRISKKDSNGVSQLIFNNERTVAGIELVLPFLYNDNITLGTNKFTGYNNIFYDLHLTKFKNNTILFNFNQLLISSDLRDMEADFGIIPTPKYNEEQENYISPTSLWWATHLMVPVTNRNLDMTGEIIESLGYHSQQLVRSAFIDITVLDKTLRDTDSEEMVNIVLDTISYDLANYFNWGGVIDMIASMARQNDINFASNWATYEKIVQKELNKTFEGFNNR